MVDWMLQKMHHGDIIVLYHMLRNGMKARAGTVQSTTQLTRFARISIFLILRMIQDVVVCNQVMGDVMDDYTPACDRVRTKIIGWLLANGPVDMYPPLADLCAKVPNKASSDVFPSPAWVYTITASWAPMSKHVAWKVPNPEKIGALSTHIDTVTKTRNEVAEKFLALCSERGWNVLTTMSIQAHVDTFIDTRTKEASDSKP